MEQLISSLSNIVWGPPVLVLLIGTGLFLTIRLKGLQFTKLPYALKLAFSKHQDNNSAGDISHFQALMTALAATVGTGNIVGVATAVVIGGPGAMVWMWMSAIVGMATKYGEAILAVKYRVTDEKGMMNICGAYCLSEYRKSGIVDELLAFLENTLHQEGISLLGVDFESFNPTAREFWGKHFIPYTVSLVRRIDEKG